MTMPRPTIDYLNARRALKPANGGKVYSREVRYAEDDGIRVLQRLSDNGLRTAIETVGGVRALASLLGLNRRAIYQWRRVPAERVIQIEKVTDVPRNVLRPDLYEGWERRRRRRSLSRRRSLGRGQYTYAQFLEMAAKGEVKARPIGVF
jgi:DNA-binding transcriptional regulator YdaS (Cro superfamily)